MSFPDKENIRAIAQKFREIAEKHVWENASQDEVCRKAIRLVYRV